MEQTEGKKTITVAVLGCGSRGAAFIHTMQRLGCAFEVVALCDWNIEQLRKTHNLCNLENTCDFLDSEVFFQTKRADLLVIATDDRYHVPQCVRAMQLGYDVLLEKPISDSREEIAELLAVQKQTQRKVVVCHELRYGAGFRKCAELLQSGAIGTLYAINASERVVYWHWAQAYVRGIGASLAKGHPAILAKCSHDLDLIQAYAKSECETVSSVGSLRFFIPENAPQGARERCIDCPHKDSCPYSAKRIYIDGWKQRGKPDFRWPFNKVSLQTPNTEESLLEGIKTGVYGRCVFLCPVEKVDHQLVQMHFKNGVDASLSMVYGAEPGRRIVFYGTHGEMTIDERREEIELARYGEEKQIISLKTLLEGGNSHGGGDSVIIRELYGVVTGELQAETPLEESVESHLMGIAAEESRLQGGVLVKVHQ